VAACPNDSLIVSFAGGACPAADRASIEAHLDGCDECRALVAILARDGSLVRRSSERTLVDFGSAATHAAELDAGRSAMIRRSHAAGDLVDGKYRVEERLGAGGMATVLAATHVGLGRTVALKFLDPTLAREPSVVARFLREGRATARLESEHVARVLDVGFDEVAQVPFLVMERLVGSDFAALLGARGKLPWSEVVRLVVPVCAALVEAHRHGIVHRDIKPSNLFLHRKADGSEIVKVLDFGISKVRESQSALTTEGAFVGSPRYMSPEQMVSARDVDEQTDVWALGVVLYEMLTGAPPWDAPTVHGLALQIAHGTPRPLLEIEATVPPALAALTHACMQKSPADRPRGAAGVAQALAALGAGAAEPEWVGAQPLATLAPGRRHGGDRRLGPAVGLVVLAMASATVVGARSLRSCEAGPGASARQEPTAPPAITPDALPTAAPSALAPPAAAESTPDLRGARGSVDAEAPLPRGPARRAGKGPAPAPSSGQSFDRRALDERK
jgi:hypothetical protein